MRSLIQRYAWGPERYHLYQFWKWSENEPDEARPARAHLWGLIFSHDAPVWSAGTPANIPRATRELGWDEKVEFIPYWRENTGIEVISTVDPVVVSGWRRRNGNLLLMIVNDSDKPDVCRLKLDLPKYGFENSQVSMRDYGAAGIGYPDSVFLPTVNRHDPDQDSPYYREPEEIEVQESIVQEGIDIQLEVKEHSYRLVRLFE